MGANLAVQIAGYWDFHPDIDNLRNIEYCNDYTNPNWTVYGEAIKICAGPYEQEVPLTDPDHNFAGTSYEVQGAMRATVRANHVLTLHSPDLPKVATRQERHADDGRLH